MALLLPSLDGALIAGDVVGDLLPALQDVPTVGVHGCALYATYY